MKIQGAYLTWKSWLRISSSIIVLGLNFHKYFEKFYIFSDVNRISKVWNGFKGERETSKIVVEELTEILNSDDHTNSESRWLHKFTTLSKKHIKKKLKFDNSWYNKNFEFLFSNW